MGKMAASAEPRQAIDENVIALSALTVGRAALYAVLHEQPKLLFFLGGALASL